MEVTKTRNRAVSVDMVRRGISLPGATSMGPVNATSVSTIGGQQSVFVQVPKKVPIMPQGKGVIWFVDYSFGRCDFYSLNIYLCVMHYSLDRLNYGRITDPVNFLLDCNEIMKRV